MSRPRVLFLLAIGLLLAVHPTLAATYAVGPCKPSLVSFPTISAAVSGVPPGSTVLVCPGTYPEQVTIAQPLTLKGITSGNAGQAVITVPGSGLTVVTTGLGDQIAAMVDVTAGPVNISDITVDGIGYSVSLPNWLVGILYNDGSSGTVNEITARNLNTSGGTGMGVWAENSTGTNQSVTIENSSFHDIDNSGVITLGSTLFATVKGNTVEFGHYQLQFLSAGNFTANVISGGGYTGITAFGPNTVSGNTVNDSIYGIQAYSGVTATSNKISNVSWGIYDFGGGSSNTYKSNAITKTGIGIDFNCQTPAVLSNTINDANIGLNNVPSSFSGANSFNNVVTLRNDGCGFRPTPPAASPSGPLRAPAH
jgi:hypothetical protein